MHLKLTGKQDVYVEIARRYREYIARGVYKDGEKLPSVREAAVELGVNPNTVSKAYTLLEEEGLVRTLPKKGAFVTASPHPPAIPDNKHTVRAWKESGITKETLLRWIEEVYQDD